MRVVYGRFTLRFQALLRGLGQGASLSSFGVPGELTLGPLGAHLRSNRSSFSRQRELCGEPESATRPHIILAVLVAVSMFLSLLYRSF